MQHWHNKETKSSPHQRVRILLRKTRRIMKVIHISDVHLGVRPDAGKPWSERRAQEIWDSFAGVIKTAAKEKVDFLLISGDLFHKQPLKRELKEVFGLFQKIPDTRVIMMAGNHDYIQQNSYYRTSDFPDNVYFFPREEITCFDFPEQNVTVYGLSYWQREIKQPLYDEVRPQNKSRVNVLLAHGGDEKHIPFSAEKILKNGFDYVAAGHIHKAGYLAGKRAVMAGALEPTDCGDIGPHGYWMIDMDKEHCETAFFSIKNCEYCHEIIRVTPGTTEYDLYSEIRELAASQPAYRYFCLTLQGRVDPDLKIDLEKIEKEDRIVSVTESLVPDYNYEKLYEEHENALLGAYILEMQKKADPIAAKALEYGVEALLGNQICR